MDATEQLPHQVTWANWSQLFLDTELWRPVVDQVLEEEGLPPAIRIRPGYPGTCAVFVADEALVLKFYPPMCLLDYRRELELYQLLADRVPMPALIAHGVHQDRTQWPYLILEFVAGRPIREIRDSLSPEDRAELARDLGRVIHAIHTTPLSRITTLDTRPSAWRALVAERRAACLEELRSRAGLAPSILVQIPDLFQSLQPLVPDGFQPCLLNADLTEDHILLTQEGGRWRLTALIDWADAEIGDPFYEWAALWAGLCDRDRDFFVQILSSYQPELQLDRDFQLRMLAYTMLHRFGSHILAHLKVPPCFDTIDELADWLFPIFRD